MMRIPLTSVRILGVFLSSLYKISIQISIVLSSGMLVNKEWTSRLAIYKLGSCLSFLGINIFCEKGKFVTNVYVFVAKFSKCVKMPDLVKT